MRVGLGIALGLAVFGCSSNESSPSSSSTGGASGTGGSDASTLPDAGPDVSLAPFSIGVFDSVRITSDSEKPNFQGATANFDWGPGAFAKVTLVVDLATTCFPFENWKTNPPPPGQNWPADCDAFDRNFEFHLDPSSETSAPPRIELVRAITPFGGPLHLEIDVTDVANARPGSHVLQVVIPTYSDAAGQVSGSNGGWNVSASFDVVPGVPPRTVIGLFPLFNGVRDTPDPIAPLSFDLPAGVEKTRLEYRVTGHGGVIGASGCGLQPAEEFCLRTHALFVDEKVFDDVMPWRDDCASLCTIAHQDNDGGGFDYCKENPCGAISSVKASRANWCPGSVTPPFEWDLAELHTSGAHDFRFQIDDVAKGGSWRVSAMLFAFGAPSN